MFKGEYEYTLDDKNRVVLPANLRRGVTEEKLKEGFVLVIGWKEQCLEVHPRQDWVASMESLRARYDQHNEEAQEYFRDIFSSAEDIDLDKNFRFIVPEVRKNQAGIEKEVYFIGVWDRIEIWDKASWLARKERRSGKQAPPRPDREG